MNYELSAAQWHRMEEFLPGRPGYVGVTAKVNRNFVNGVLWVLRSGAQWKDLPLGYGNWKSVHKRFTPGPGPESGRKSSGCCWTILTTVT